MGTTKFDKKVLYEACKEHVEARIFHLKEIMKSTQDAVNDESKSSMGDKYETNRSMLQLENEQHAIQLNEALKLKKSFDSLTQRVFTEVQPGALVYTNKGNFYFSVSMGKITHEKVDYFAVSIASPLGQALIGKIKGESINFNSIKYTIKEIV